jgi:hypothetical protein
MQANNPQIWRARLRKCEKKFGKLETIMAGMKVQG